MPKGCVYMTVCVSNSMLTHLQDVENIVALPNEAAEAEEMLKDDSQLLQVIPIFCCPPVHTAILDLFCCCDCFLMSCFDLHSFPVSMLLACSELSLTILDPYCLTCILSLVSMSMSLARCGQVLTGVIHSIITAWVNSLRTQPMAWHGMAWHGMAWHSIA